MGKRKNPIVIDTDLLNKKGTEELLGYLKRLHQCEESFELSDLDVDPDLKDEKTIYFKNTSKWKLAYDNVRSILGSREHIEKTKNAAKGI